MPSLGSFAMTKLLFAATGTCFALIKVSVYATIGIVTENKKEHASFMNLHRIIFYDWNTHRVLYFQCVR